MDRVEGRQRGQCYKGRGDWAAISPVGGAVAGAGSANGDSHDTASAGRALAQSGAAGVMVGRAVRGQPWLLARIAAGLAGHAAPAIPEREDFLTLISEHYRDMLSFYGTGLGLRCARKHLGWFLEKLDPDPWLRKDILTQTDPDRVLALLAQLSPDPPLCKRVA